MKLAQCIDLARDCGLETYREAIANVEIHSMMLFEYTTLNDEIKELHSEFVASGRDLDEYLPSAYD